MNIDTIRFKEEMIKSGMKQKELAQKVGVTEVSISRYVSGERQPRGIILVKIAEALSTTPEYLCGLGIEHSSSAYARVRGNIMQYCAEWTADQKRELLNLLVS